MKEIWKDIPGYEGLYQASNLGQVRSLPWPQHHKEAIILKTFKNNSGYLCLSILGRKMLVHRLVAMTFIQEHSEKDCVNHIDGDKTNNRVDNLEWVSSSDNMMHSTYVLMNGRRCRVKCVETGEVFDSIREASRSMGIHFPNIVASLNGRLKTAGGYHWERIH